jgi:hypothetical protein
MNSYIENFYRSNNKRKYSLYTPGYNRFLLVDDLDIWMLFETANIVSSKISTIVYMLPYEETDISNDNCLNYEITNLSSQKIAGTPLIFASQTPLIKSIFGDNVIKKNNEHLDILNDAKKYVDFVHLHSYALNYTEFFTNYENNYNFSKKYLDEELLDTFRPTHERSTLKQGIFFNIRKILYLSDSIDEAETKLHKLWKDESADLPQLRELYFKILNKSQPEDLHTLVRSFNFTSYSG